MEIIITDAVGDYAQYRPAFARILRMLCSLEIEYAKKLTIAIDPFFKSVYATAFEIKLEGVGEREWKIQRYSFTERDIARYENEGTMLEDFALDMIHRLARDLSEAMIYPRQLDEMDTDSPTETASP